MRLPRGFGHWKSFARERRFLWHWCTITIHPNQRPLKNLYNVFVDYIGKDVAEKIEKIAIAIKQTDGYWLDLHTKQVYSSLNKLFDEYHTNYGLKNFASTYEYAWIVSNDIDRVFRTFRYRWFNIKAR